jgi:hypothetical protein
MRQRTIFGLIGIIVLLVLTVLSFRALSPEPASSPASPPSIARNGLDQICAEQAAVDQADQDSVDGFDAAPPTTDPLAAQLAQLKASDPAGYAAFVGATGGAPRCPTTTTTAP